MRPATCRRRINSAVDRHHGFDKAADPTGGLGVAHDRFQRSDPAETAGVFILPGSFIGQRCNRLQLDTVTDSRTGAVAFDEIQFFNSIVRIIISSFQRQGLAGNTGCGNGGIAAVG